MKFVSFSLVVLLLIGCASTPKAECTKGKCKSSVVSKLLVPGEPQSGVIYLIPKQLLKFSLKREKITKAKLKENLDKAKKLLNEKTKEVKKQEKIVLPRMQAMIEAAGIPSEPITIQALEKKKLELEIEKLNLLALKNDERAAKAAHQAADTALKNHTKDSFQDTIKIKAQDPIPDSNLRFIANVNQGAFSSETVEIKTTSSGLLSGGSGESRGQADEIFIKLAGAIASLSGAPIELLGPGSIKTLDLESYREVDDRTKEGEEPEKPACPRKDAEFEYIFSLNDEPELGILNRKLDELELCTVIKPLITFVSTEQADDNQITLGYSTKLTPSEARCKYYQGKIL